MMNYFLDAFGPWDPDKDKDAAVKFCLNAALQDKHFGLLAQLLANGVISGFGGDPGWSLDRNVQNNEDELDWLEGAEFHASVDPDGYELAFPEAFYRRDEFERYVQLIMQDFLAKNPTRAYDAAPILAAMKAVDGGSAFKSEIGD